MSQPRTVAVIGSLNIDFITTTPRIPAGGETMTATSFNTGFGGKGANQAVACARLSRSRKPTSASPDAVQGKTAMVGAVGDDPFGNDYFRALGEEGIDVTHVRKVDGITTGSATIIVEEGTGENRIMVCTGANYSFDGLPDLVPAEADVVVFQLEMRIDLVLHNMKLAHERGKYVIINPAPALKLPSEAYAHIDCLIMNESEADILAEGGSADLTSYLDRGVRDMVVKTLGAAGVAWRTTRQKKDSPDSHVAGQKAKVVDTTAAGDTFVGGLAVQIARNGGKSPEDATDMFQFANAAAAKTVQKAGAMAAIPYLDEIV